MMSGTMNKLLRRLRVSLKSFKEGSRAGRGCMQGCMQWNESVEIHNLTNFALKRGSHSERERERERERDMVEKKRSRGASGKSPTHEGRRPEY